MKAREFWIRDQVLNFGDLKGAKFVAFESSDVEGKGIIHVIEAAPVLAEIKRLKAELAETKKSLSDLIDAELRG